MSCLERARALLDVHGGRAPVSLPGSLADCWAMAVTDMGAVFASPGAEPHWREWVAVRGDHAPCAACAAGAVMLRRLGAAEKIMSLIGGAVAAGDTHGRVSVVRLYPDDYGGDANMLRAIDYVRSGQPLLAYCEALGRPDDEHALTPRQRAALAPAERLGSGCRWQWLGAFEGRRGLRAFLRLAGRMTGLLRRAERDEPGLARGAP